MPLPIFKPPVAPSPGTNSKPEINIATTEFGDGYTQETRKGINHRRDVLSLKWDALTPAQGREILAFFEERGGDRAFWFQSALDAKAKKWTCREYSPTVADGLWSFSATLRQSFTLQE